MLGVHGMGRDGADYYLSDLARELPEPVPGRWTGAAAAALGLERRAPIRRSSAGCSGGASRGQGSRWARAGPAWRHST